MGHLKETNGAGLPCLCYLVGYLDIYSLPQHLSHHDETCISQLKGPPMSRLQQLSDEIISNGMDLKQEKHQVP